MSQLKFGDPSSIYLKEQVESQGTSRHIAGMYASFGHGPERAACGDCAHFRSLFPILSSDKTETGKCVVYDTTFPNRFKGWRKENLACGKFDHPNTER